MNIVTGILNNYISIIKIITILLPLSLMSLIITQKKYISGINKLKKYEIDISMDVKEEIDEFIYSVITDSITEYMFLNSLVSATSISKDREIDMSVEIPKILMKRISPNALNKICIVYNKDDIHTLIAHRSCMVISAYIADINKK